MTARNPNYANQNPTDSGRSGTTGTQDNSTTDQVKQSAGQVADQTQQAASQVADQAKQAAKSQLAVRKDQTAQGLNFVSSAVSDMGDKLRQNDQTSSYAQLADQAANQVQRFAGYLKNHDVREIVGDVEDWARRDPMLALGGAFVLGLVAARFLKSSGVQTGSSRRSDSYYNPAYRYNNQYSRSDNEYSRRYGRQYSGNPQYGRTYRPSGQYWDEQYRSSGDETKESQY